MSVHPKTALISFPITTNYSCITCSTTLHIPIRSSFTCSNINPTASMTNALVRWFSEIWGKIQVKKQYLVRSNSFSSTKSKVSTIQVSWKDLEKKKYRKHYMKKVNCTCWYLNWCWLAIKNVQSKRTWEKLTVFLNNMKNWQRKVKLMTLS